MTLDLGSNSPFVIDRSKRRFAGRIQRSISCYLHHYNLEMLFSDLLGTKPTRDLENETVTWNVLHASLQISSKSFK